jgi:glycosyltransferase involved in cell wall biosynthesis
MKVAHITSDLSYGGAGLSNAVRDLAVAQSQLNNLDVRVFGGVGSITEGPFDDLVNTSHTKYPYFGPSQLGFFPKIQKDLLRFKPDILHVHGLWTFSIWHGYEAAKRLKIPLIVSPHGMLSNYSLNRSLVKKRLFSMFFQDLCIRSSSILHATCAQEFKEISCFVDKGRIRIITNGINDFGLDSAEKSSCETRTLLYLGRIHEKKGIDLLLRAWVQLSKFHSDWRLRIVGMDENNELARLKKLSIDLGVDRVDFEGPVFGQQKVEVYAGADLFVLPTKNENFGSVVAESLISGVPVVCSKYAPWEGLETRMCGRWIDLDLQIFVSTLSDLMSRPTAELAEMGQNGRAWMLEEFTWKSVACKFSSLYQEALR